MTAQGESKTEAPEEPALPDCLTLWFCIGCGAMGNNEPCQGACNFQRLEIVSAAEYARALEQQDEALSEVAAWTSVLAPLASLPADDHDWESAYRALQARASAALKSAGAPLAQGDITDARAEVWLCATCGQVEAPQECLGICIRRNGDFVRRQDYQQADYQATATREHAQQLRRLVTQWASVTPRAGQWESSYRALQARAQALLASLA
ncbi:MAG: hypothetical protein KGQ37_13305 [Hyphomicrobiales bacterium]|nr:hypothetical protein [Hyphomicrobiales bacterium]